jgi:NAD(P)-dependent dehydrogenase (short-subunit alcohol dehydrogenase family)
MELEGKIAFITGGATGIGRATAELFAREGAEVWIADINEELGQDAVTAITATGGRAGFVRVDVSDPDSMEAAVAQASAGPGRLDCAVNCAAITHTGKRLPTGEVDLEVFDRIVKVDLRGMFISVQHEIRAMLEHGGSIVNCSSGSGIVGARFNPSYVAAKHGVVGLSKAAALDYADDGIRVNTLVPGLTATPILEGIPPGTLRATEAAIPMKRVARPLEIAQGALWLCSDRSSYATGSTLVIDGGFTTA